MTGQETAEHPLTEIFSAQIFSAQIFRALSDPIRWSIIAQAAQVDEVACLTLESTLPVAKPTISYHVKILQHAGLISTRKAGRNYYYSLRREVIEELADSLWELAPTPRPVIGTQKGSASRRWSRRSDQATSTSAGRPAVSRPRAGHDDVEEAAVLTW
jgi:DNA-binding transcriptional ArsR family regulator